MKIKKCISLRRGYLNYTFDSEPKDLSNDVIEICKKLKKGLYIVEVFSKDLLNNILLSNARYLCQSGNFSYYLCDQIEFCRMIDFANIKHICIYSILELTERQIDAKYLNNNFTFCVCFENYLNTSQLLVCRKYYSTRIAAILFSDK